MSAVRLKEDEHIIFSIEFGRCNQKVPLLEVSVTRELAVVRI